MKPAWTQPHACATVSMQGVEWILDQRPQGAAQPLELQEGGWSEKRSLPCCQRAGAGPALLVMW